MPHAKTQRRDLLEEARKADREAKGEAAGEEVRQPKAFRIRNPIAAYKPEVVTPGPDFVAFQRRQLEALCLQLGIPATLVSGV